MVKINKSLVIVRTTEPGLSSMSKRSCDAILLVLSSRYAQVKVVNVNCLADLQSVVADRPDLVFIGMKFIPVNYALGLHDPAKIWITEYLDDYAIAYTGSGPRAHELELNKPLAKQRALDAGLKTSPFYVAAQNQPQNRVDMVLTFPLFIKPTNRGGGLGIDSKSVANNFNELDSKILSITTSLQSDSLVEEYLPGREFSVAVLKDQHSPEFLVMPIEKIAPLDKHGKRILSGAIKSADTAHDYEVNDLIVKNKLTALALDVFHALGARDYGRIDIRLDQFGTPHFLEANLLPSLIKDYGSFPKACMINMNLDYGNMVLQIAELGLAHQKLPKPAKTLSW